uniref:Pentatricopeptide repeat-containing protein n=1 Tax=Ananas comosus var. bracteatus TaxID=296719 RepID=A0A6V7PPW1_ANACO|nr:unnamed protein product [Ananas comosus var. bracteatus]
MYALCGRIDAAQQLFDKMPNRNVVSWNTLLDGFVKSGDIDSAYEVFDAMPERNVVSWNSMIAGFVKNDLPREALMLFIEMMVCGLVPDEYTMASVISAISDLGLLDLGRRAHGYVTRRGFLLCGALRRPSAGCALRGDPRPAAPGGAPPAALLRGPRAPLMV